jgi:hypothetical protein
MLEPDTFKSIVENAPLVSIDIFPIMSCRLDNLSSGSLFVVQRMSFATSHIILIITKNLLN